MFGWDGEGGVAQAIKFKQVSQAHESPRPTYDNQSTLRTPNLSSNIGKQGSQGDAHFGRRVFKASRLPDETLKQALMGGLNVVGKTCPGTVHRAQLKRNTRIGLVMETTDTVVDGPEPTLARRYSFWILIRTSAARGSAFRSGCQCWTRRRYNLRMEPVGPVKISKAL